jgi:hypothetical protein
MASAMHATGDPKWWISEDGSPRGPHSTAYIIARLLTSTITAETLACLAGTEEWRPVARWSTFSQYVQRIPRVPDQTAVSIRDVGLALRHLQLAILGCLIVHALSLVAMVAESLTSGAVGARGLVDLLNTIVGFGFLTVYPYLFYSVWKVIKASQASMWWLLTICPWLGLFGLFVLSRQTSTMLNDAGIRLGLMGPRVEDLPPI